MKVCYIIPSLFRDSLQQTINSIKQEDPNATIIICGNIVANPTATAHNRNMALNAIKNEDFDWLVFVDDDDVLVEGYLSELNPYFDLVVLRMYCNGEYIPKYGDNRLYECNVGINIAINLKTVKHIPKFDKTKHHEDWHFIQDILDLNDIKHNVSEQVRYMVQSKGNKQ